MKKVFLILILTLSVKISFAFITTFQFDSTGRERLWRSIDLSIAEYQSSFSKSDSINKVPLLILREKALEKLRDSGLIFWNKFPADSRRYDWLITTMENIPFYYDYNTKQFKEGKIKQWKEVYPIIRAQYMDYLSLLDSSSRFRKECWFKILELQYSIRCDEFYYKTLSRKVDINKYKLPVLSLSKVVYNTDYFFPFINRICQPIVTGQTTMGFSLDAIKEFLNELKEENIPQLSKWVNGKLTLLSKSDHIVDLSFSTINFGEIRTKQLKGRTILIDFWATWCGSCLAYMPFIKELYNKYRSQGFVVISVSLDKLADTGKIVAIEKKLNLDWPLAIIGGTEQKEKIWREFGFTFIPQLMLINKDGRLINSDGKLLDKNELEKALIASTENE